MEKPKKNCWEYMRCGREPGGATVPAKGVCPAAVEKKLDGINGGSNAGRICWLVAGTLCDEEVQGTFAQKILYCHTCRFFIKVKNEEGKTLVLETEYLDDQLLDTKA